ncbi:hypothetical protein [Aurantimonas endophytica]|uniref:Uncharacterized protein n=1 Tax=Aurantimonas endophytica TaxID=1522175 RepID=A0A7W6MML7_9HYPH|nr:hypothetical protein [Aurantimonas endophytica]MBB4000990.1 hypothetical protein [Aurantimonas endophytica]MCO6403353.1 hypothetical protein [Aurantimonas endophytica]
MKNRIIAGMLLSLALYWGTGLLAAGPWFGAMLAAVLFVSSTVLMIQLTPDFIAVAKEGKIGDDRLSLMGLYLIAFGGCYSGVFTMTWASFGNPSEWLNTPFSGFGRATITAGFWLLIVSPNSTPDRVRLPKWWVLVLAIIAMVAMAFALGIRVGDKPVREGNFLVRKGPVLLMTPKPMALAAVATHPP